MRGSALLYRAHDCTCFSFYDAFFFVSCFFFLRKHFRASAAVRPGGPSWTHVCVVVIVIVRASPSLGETWKGDPPPDLIT